MSDGSVYTCGVCSGIIEPDAPDTVPAHRQIKAETYGDGPTEYLDGPGIYFHRRCYQGDSKYFRRAS